MLSESMGIPKEKLSDLAHAVQYCRRVSIDYELEGSGNPNDAIRAYYMYIASPSAIFMNLSGLNNPPENSSDFNNLLFEEMPRPLAKILHRIAPQINCPSCGETLRPSPGMQGNFVCMECAWGPGELTKFVFTFEGTSVTVENGKRKIL